MGFLQQIKLSYRMTVAATRMTLRYPKTILVALASLAALTVIAVGPIVTMIRLSSTDPAAFRWALDYVFQFWFVEDSIKQATFWDPASWMDVVWHFTMWLLFIYTVWMTIVAFVSLVTQTIIMHTGVQQLRGQRPSIADGWRLAMRNVWRLAGLALVAGVLIGLTRRFTAALRAVPFVGRILRGAILAALTGALYMALPVVVYERKGPWAGFVSTWRQVRQTWGGLVVGTGLWLSALWVGLWFVFWMVSNAFGKVDWSTVLVIQLFLAVALYCLNIALTANLRAALYLHVTEGHTGVLPEGALANPGAIPPNEPTTTFEVVS